MNDFASNGQNKIRELQPHYRSGKNSLASDFFSPCLEHCCSYKRAAGYFSSSALVTWASALPRLAADEDVIIKLIASPQLTAEDIATLKTIVEDQAKTKTLTAGDFLVLIESSKNVFVDMCEKSIEDNRKSEIAEAK